MEVKRMNFDRRVGKDISPRTPGRAHPHLLALLKFLEQELPDIQHYYQGGFFIGEYTKEPRYTQDLDMSILELPAYERVKQALVKYGDYLTSTNVISRYAVKDSVSERSSGGAKFYAPDGSTLFSIDIGFHEIPLQTVAIEISDVGNISITTVEQMLCDKLSALFSDRRLRRIKDLYDAWHILTTCQVDAQQLIFCLNQRNLFPLPSVDAPFTDDHIVRVEAAYNTLSVVDVGNERAKELPKFSNVIEVVGGFYITLTDAEV